MQTDQRKTLKQPKIYTGADHHIRNDLISPNALLVLRRLQEAGYTAYIVGGGVRDLLMKKRPKDFDISTSARPEEIKAIFRRQCLLIGRRFRLAHIRFGEEIIEVATFRAGDPEGEELIVRDNVFGTPEQDVLRRDFTINGLFYDAVDHRIIDYVDGFEDIGRHLLRSIGDPMLRFKQDPVRMIRLQKFTARFGFNVERETLLALESCRGEIIKSSPARILEEVFRMLESGSAATFFEHLHATLFLAILLPPLHVAFDDQKLRAKLLEYLRGIDAMNFRGHYKLLPRSILATALVFPLLEEAIVSSSPPMTLGQIIDKSFELIDNIASGPLLPFPRKIKSDMQAIMQLQYRLIPLDPKKKPSLRLLRQKESFDAIIFLKLRALLDPSLFKTYEFWKRHRDKEETA